MTTNGMRLIDELIEEELIVGPAASHLHAGIVRRTVKALEPREKWEVCSGARLAF